MDTLIANATIVTMNEGMEVLFGGYLGVTGGKISYLAKTPPAQPPAAIVDGAGMVVLPGLVNCHTQLASTALRGLVDDLPNKGALEAILQKEEKLDARSAKAAASLGIAECLRFGVTSVSDLYYYPEATAQAAEEAGIKANLALSAYRFEDENEPFDFETDPQCREVRRLAEKWNGFDGGRIRIDAGIYAEYTSNHPLWEGLSAYARQEGLGFQLHLDETPSEADSCLERTGLTPGELLDCHGVFGVPAAAVGCGYLSDGERALLGRRHVSAVATPIASGKAGFRTVAVTDCVKSGMNVALGTGGAPQAGNLDLFEAMRSMALSARREGGDASALPAPAALMMATVCGARAQGRQAECGMLKIGMDADLILVDFSAPHLIPSHNVLSSLVFSAKGGDVAMTMVRGKTLYRNGRFPTLDLPAIVKELTDYAIPRLFARERS